MLQPSPNRRVAATIINSYPDCLAMELESEKCGELRSDLFLTIVFNEQTETISGGEIIFGIKRGELKIKFENAYMKLADRKLGGQLEVRQDVDTTRETGTERQGGADLSISGKSIRPSASLSTKSTDKYTEKGRSVNYRVTTKGDRNSTVWRFEELASNKSLKGMLQDSCLGTVTVKRQGVWGARVRFYITMKDIFVTGSGGLWAQDDLHSNKYALIQRMVVGHLLERKLKSPMSGGDLVSRCHI